ncbi:MAG: hypothetical protein CML68_14020 [Rhodobacteraceae bacterium]|nr:hypothetical protein [Paracoccaceae bacterium]
MLLDDAHREVAFDLPGLTLQAGCGTVQFRQGTFLCGDIEELPFDDATFDIVSGFNSFQYAGNPGAATASRALNSTGVAARAIEHAGRRTGHDAHEKAISAFIDGQGRVSIGATFRCMIATDP